MFACRSPFQGGAALKVFLSFRRLSTTRSIQPRQDPREGVFMGQSIPAHRESKKAEAIPAQLFLEFWRKSPRPRQKAAGKLLLFRPSIHKLN